MKYIRKPTPGKIQVSIVIRDKRVFPLPYHSTETLQVHESAKPMWAYGKDMRDTLIHLQDPSQPEFPTYQEHLA